MSKKFSFGRLTLLVAVAAMLGASAADARIHSLTGDARFQIGNGLPIPIGATPAPNGRVAAVAGATIRQHDDGANPDRIVIDPGQLTAPGNAINLGVFLSNPNVFQVQTAIPVTFPNRKVSFAAGGRTGAATVTFCPGETVTENGNPGCAIATPAIPGSLTYTATGAQFGGPAQANTGGSANVALRVASGAPCAYGAGANPLCQVIFALATPAPSAAAGQPFGFFNQTAGGTPATGRYYATITTLGAVTGITATGLGPGVPNPATSYGGPWTTGRLTVSQPAATPAELFVLSGSDGRAGATATGSISLVAGAVSARALSGPNANRGWLNLTVGSSIGSVPVLPAYGVAALVGLTALTGAYALRRRASK